MAATPGQKLALTTLTLAGSEVLFAATHSGGIGVVLGIGAGLIAWHCADDLFKGGHDPSLPAPEEERVRAPKRVNKWLVGKSARREWSPSDEEHFDEGATLDRILSQHRAGKINDEQTLALLDQLTHRTTDAHEDDEDFDDDETLAAKRTVFRFSELLASGFLPRIDKIFVGRTMDGQDIFVPASKLCHVAIAGKTGGGKGSLMRMIMTQLCFIGVRVLLLNPHYMRMVRAEEGEEFDEDWSPFEGMNPRTGRPYLEASPLECAEMGNIERHLRWAVETLLQNRMKAAREGGKRFTPYFIVIDEWPSIAKKIKAAPDYLAYLLREGRKFGVFVIVASQDFQVKTIGMEGGSVRKCLLTCFYTGGDPTTAKELLYPEPSKVTIPESDLGKGTIMMRCTGTENKAVLALVPFVDNEAVYGLLGPSTFARRRDEHEADELQEPTTRRVESDDPLTLPNTETLEETVTADPVEKVVVLGRDSSTGRDVTITREEYRIAVNMRKKKLSTGHRDLMDVFDLSEHHARALNTLVRKELGLDTKGERERERESDQEALTNGEKQG